MAPSAELRAQLRTIVTKRMSRDSAHDLAHLDRVWLNVQKIAPAEANPAVLLGAAYLHDLVNLPKDSPERSEASRMAATEAGPILADLGLTEAEVKATQHAIEAHSFSAGIPPETIEAQVLRDADRLDALGAIGVARTFAVAGALGQELYHPTDPFAETRDLNDIRYSVDHWRVKLLSLPKGMITDNGRELAQARAALMIRFLDDFADEIGATVPEAWIT
ncbi:HD domain-containing protein [Tropicibacter sp. Alg240-R139]|uniref:HD domain-containing protein n=1 Tax=Tropicibacter sp. Alg240-R139 TaxID=2305991 RepID=UPI0013DEFDF5|nr:HD domain-containing protein [Tropicibacter sp. Alg240-R139]